MLWMLALASAHSPHDVVPALSVVKGELVLGEEVRLAWSPDEGQTLHHGDSPGSVAECLAALTGTAGAVLLVTRLPAAFISLDGGASWSPLPNPAPTACAPGVTGALVADADGVRRVTAAASTPEVEDSTSVVAISESAGGTLFAIATTGELLREADGSWAPLDPGPFTALTAGDGVLLRGSAVGIELSRDEGDTWAFVSDIPAARLGAGATAWMAATLDDGVWLSVDEGKTWIVDRTGIEPPVSGEGAPEPGGTHWFALIDDGGTLWAAAWEGLYRRLEGESGWTQIQTRGQPWMRDLTWVNDGLLVADNGSGLALGEPGEAGWVDTAPRLTWPWLRSIVATEGGEGRWFFGGGQHLYISDDQGASVWAATTGAFIDGDVVAVAPGWPADARVWETGQDEAGFGLVLESDDGGDSWAPTTLPACHKKPSAIAAGEEVVVVGCDTGIWRRKSAGVWTELLAPGDRVNSLLVDGTDVFAGTPTGVWRITNEVTAVYGPGPVDSMAWEPDGSMLIGAIGGLIRITDGEATALGWPQVDVVTALAVAADGRIAAGTFAGAWVSDDRGESWLLATDWDRYDDFDTAFSYTSEWTREEAPTAKSRAMSAGTTSFRWRVEAARLALTGAGPATFDVSIDGGEPEEVTVDDDGLRRLWAGAVEPGWHTLDVEVSSGTLRFDGGERWRLPGELATVSPPTPEPECGCQTPGSRPGAAGLALAAATVVLVRRRYPGCRAANAVQ